RFARASSWASAPAWGEGEVCTLPPVFTPALEQSAERPHADEPAVQKEREDGPRDQSADERSDVAGRRADTVLRPGHAISVAPDHKAGSRPNEKRTEQDDGVERPVYKQMPDC